jgi:hypothetical protein
MNCIAVRRRLLASERPDQPPANLWPHLSRCRACRACQRRLAEAERLLPLLPVPPSSPEKRAALVRQILHGEPEPPRARARARLRAAGRQKVALAFALAAGLAVFAVCWWAWSREPPPGRAEQLYAAHRAERDSVLREAHTPRERVMALAKLADDLVARAGRHRGDVERLAVLARFYGSLVRTDLPQHVRGVPGPDRRELVERVSARLRRAESEVSRLRAEQPARSAVAHSLGEIAAAARDGDVRLRALVG